VGTVTEVEDLVVEEEASAVIEEDVPQRSCGRCGGSLATHNRSGVCTPCQLRCPDCGGPKAPQSPRCRQCAHGGEDPVGPATVASVADRALQDLPVRVQELLDDLLALAHYAKALEDELESYREASRQMQRVSRRAEAALSRRAS
jgi:hypothetical protein